MTDGTLYPGQKIPLRIVQRGPAKAGLPSRTVVRPTDVVLERPDRPTGGAVWILGRRYPTPNLCGATIQDIAENVAGGAWRWVLVQQESERMGAGWVDTSVPGGKCITPKQAETCPTAEYSDHRYRHWFSVGWPGSKDRVHLKNRSLDKLAKVLRELFPMRDRS